MNKEEMNPIDKLFDEDNCDNIILHNENGEPNEFEQIAIIPKGDVAYAILKPTFELEGVDEDEGLVFAVNTNDDGEDYLELVTDELIVEEIFSIYFSLIEDEDASDV